MGAKANFNPQSDPHRSVVFKLYNNSLTHTINKGVYKMRESREYNQDLFWKYARHSMVLTNAILSIGFLHYACWLLYKVYQFIF